jgi:hypothetical protein
MTNDEASQTVTVNKQTGKILKVEDPHAQNRSLTSEELEAKKGLQLAGVILYGHSSPG